jgi:hypothetical protein
MKIRKASMADAKAIQRVLFVLKIPGVPWADWHTMVVIREAIGEGRYYVAEAYGTIIGAMSVVRHRRIVEIGTLAVRRWESASGSCSLPASLEGVLLRSWSPSARSLHITQNSSISMSGSASKALASIAAGNGTSLQRRCSGQFDEHR